MTSSSSGHGMAPLSVISDRNKFRFVDDDPTSSKSEGETRRYAYFSDGWRRVDYVLAYEANENADSEDEPPSDDDDLVARYMLSGGESNKAKRRRIYESNLKMRGLELEHVKGEFCSNIRFVLVHVPFDLLCKQAEKLGIEMRVRSDLRPERTTADNCLDQLLKRCPLFTFPEEIQAFIREPRNQYYPFTCDDFSGSGDAENLFSSADRIFIAHDILCRTRYGRGDRLGIENMLKREIYTAAYPLHEYLDYEKLRSQPCKMEEERTPFEMKKFSTRQFLYWLWAKLRYFYKFQPLFLIKEYFGSKIAIYFVLVGYYTKFLIPCALLGVICFLFGLFTISYDLPSSEICRKEGMANDVIMCPSCDKWCDYTRLNSSCFFSKLSYIFDNISTVVFAILMSVGATLFIEGWKRYNADVAWRLGLLDTGSHEEGIRLAYLLQSLRSSNIRDPYTRRREPAAIPLSKRLPTILASGVTVVFFLCLILGAVIGTIVYRIVLMQVLYRVNSMRPFAAIFTSVTTAILNLIVILAMSYVYSFLALKLTDWEYPRTQSEFEKSYTVKVFLFQFINYYSSIFYVAFFKGNFSGLPGRRVLGLRPEDCDPAGCMVELVILLTTIMFGKTAYNAAMEFFNPVILTLFRGCTLKIPESRSQKFERFRRQRRREMDSAIVRVPRWEWDYALTPTYEQFLFDEYLDIVIQFGFVTLFVSAFPLAPLFALINNLLEARLDAYKFVVATRRPLPERAKDPGVWLSIMDLISKAAVLTNAFVIAFTSDFIPRMVYLYGHPSLEGYVNSTLSLFESSSLHTPEWSQWHNVTACWFRDFRKPPCTLRPLADCDDKYGVTSLWWVILSFRLGFVIVFAHAVLAVKAFIAYVIPDMPTRVFIQLQRQRSLSFAELSEGTRRSM
ncbi:Anoctamin-5 [Toxocara canis]|uniref:Anoctamin n=1 Tax=Toxocara canis TaxID=6265 RepID=A0A0B2VX62_TOXCA|nr:Anoctamin-5 [Toxocara canis]